MKNVTRRFAVLVLTLLVIVFSGKSVFAENIENNNNIQTSNDANAVQDITVIPDVQITPTVPGGDIYIIPDEPVPAGSAIVNPADSVNQDNTVSSAGIISTEEAVPGGTAVLPETGEVPGVFFYAAGILITSIGILLKKK